jgi:hypothetical protein
MKVPQDRTENRSGKANRHNERAQGEAQRPPKGTYAIKFLRRLRPKGPWLLTSIDPHGGKIITRTVNDLEKARKFIVAQNIAGRNIHYSINPARTPLNSKATKEDIARVEYLHVDADPLAKESTEKFKARLRPLIEAYRPKPTFIVDSGNGFQLLVRLGQAVEITSQDVIDDIEARNYALALAFGADPKTRNIDRLFRVPGTINFPNSTKRKLGRKKARAKLIQYNNVAYPLAKFSRHRPATNATPNTQTRTGATTELPANLRTFLLTVGAGGYPSRSELLFAFLTGAIRARLSDNAIIKACLDERYKGKGIFEHINDNGGRQVAERQLQRAHAKIAERRTDRAAHSWEDPDLSMLDERRGDLPAFPLDTLQPQKLRDWVTRAASSRGTTIDHVAVPILGGASSLIGSARCVGARSFVQPASLWTFVIGYSGTGKTPGLDATREPLVIVEKMRQPEIAKLKREHEERAARAEAASNKWKEELNEAVKNGSTTPPKPLEAELPAEFVEPRLYTTDITVERMAVLLQARPQGLLLLIDELAAWLHNMRRYTGGDNTQFWLMAWDGKPYKVDRMSRPSVKLDGLLVSVVGGLQPDKLHIFSQTQDGFSARPLYAWPDMPPYRPLTNANATDDEMAKVFDRLDRLAREESAPIRLCDNALAEFEKLRKRVHKNLPAFRGREREWLAKVPAQVLRLAATLALLHWAIATEEGTAEPTEIKAVYVKNAAHLATKYFWLHARAALRQIGLTERHSDARRILVWLAAKRCAEVSREEIRRKALGRSRDADQTQSLLDKLVEAGWLRPRSAVTGGRPSVRYEVNPKLFRDRSIAR